MKFSRVSRAMEKAGIPGKDAYDLPTSKLRFPDGAWYRMEVSGVERPSVLEAVVDESHKRKMPIHRLISVVMGATLLDKAELRDFAQIAAAAKMEVILTPGPRSAWDTGRQVATPEGALSGLRFRGSDQLRYVIADIMRCIDIGFRGFLVIDEGLLWLLNEMKKNGDITLKGKSRDSPGRVRAEPGQLAQHLRVRGELPAMVCDDDLRRDAIATIEAIRHIKSELPGVQTTLGLSNVSFGLSPAARHALNSVFLHECVQAGLDTAIAALNADRRATATLVGSGPSTDSLKARAHDLGLDTRRRRRAAMAERGDDEALRGGGGDFGSLDAAHP